MISVSCKEERHCRLLDRGATTRGNSWTRGFGRIAAKLFEQVLGPARELSDLPDTDPVRTVELFHPVCLRRVDPGRPMFGSTVTGVHVLTNWSVLRQLPQWNRASGQT